jgi:two-component system phosphate regulon sensor histidine kinase PhoR
MHGWLFSQTSRLPTTTFVFIIVGAILAATPWVSFGLSLLAFGLILLWLWYRRIRSALYSLRLINTDREIDWDALARILIDLERENKALKGQAQKEDQLLRSILANLNVGVILLDPYRQIYTYNPAAQRLLGASSHVLNNGTVADLLNDPESLSMFDKAYKGGASTWGRDRAGRILSYHAIPLTINAQNGDANSSWGGVLLVIQDITQQEALEQTRQKFISNASHELKTPVTSIRVAAENLMDDGWIPPEGEGNIKIILRNIDRMTLLLNDITELSRIETGALTLEQGPFLLEAFLKDMIDNAHPLAKYKNVQLLLDIEPCLVAKHFISDPLRLNQLIENLLSNAIKFSPDNSTVQLAARLEDQWIVFSVRDNGPGIPPKDSARIFERFYRTQSARGVPGTGLGLAIVKHLCRVMGGEVNFESAPDKETTFYVKLPWETPDLRNL